MSGSEAVSTSDVPEKKDCPICVMFREGGCEQDFNNFMDCGVRGEKGEGDYKDCVPLFEAMRQCMQRNPAVFGEVLKDVEELSKTNTEYPEESRAQTTTQQTAGSG
ncbi:Oxidoreductase [Pleodorina starrii]|uniref:Oxidoreductase n=1 Tax=Pleodorina starrii TaxID=330485 RepID=A0A9W6BY73_9CHLO|nr:Oxidoreductase [Pleodorina starrii]GLC60288.1 Oxidoreductase [Pleodorina starrii]GLC66050.1 Oxidoreductase [Pleodorina starrii]